MRTIFRTITRPARSNGTARRLLAPRSKTVTSRQPAVAAPLQSESIKARLRPGFFFACLSPSYGFPPAKIAPPPVKQRTVSWTRGPLVNSIESFRPCSRRSFILRGKLVATPTVKTNLSGLGRRLVMDGILAEEPAQKAFQEAIKNRQPFVALLVEKK